MKKIITSLLLSTLLLCSTTFAANRYISAYSIPEVRTFINYMAAKHPQLSKFGLIVLFKQVNVTVASTVHGKVKKFRPLEAAYWPTYRAVFITPTRINYGVTFWQKYQDTLTRAQKTYGVPASIISGIIGVETQYGQHIGKTRIVDALTTQAFSHARRSGYFRDELEEFLMISHQLKINPLTVKGSYAGAFGIPQFMPSSYRLYAVNFSGRGTADLLTDPDNAIGSVANYFLQKGWQSNQPVAVPAYATGNKFKKYLSGLKPTLTIAQWEQLGIKPKYPVNKNERAILIALDYPNGTNEYWLGFNNFCVIKRYNPSDKYAMAVYELSNKLFSAVHGQPRKIIPSKEVSPPPLVSHKERDQIG